MKKYKIKRNREFNDLDLRKSATPSELIVIFQKCNIERQAWRKIERSYMVSDDGTQVLRKTKDGWNPVCIHDETIDKICNFCFPNSSKRGCRIKCQFLDLLQNEIGVDIQHVHYDTGLNAFCGDAHRCERLKIDGFYETETEKIAIEFLDDYWSGHPRCANLKRHPNRIGCFLKTEQKLKTIKENGYRVFYIWQPDFYKRNRDEPLLPLCKEFHDKLET